MTPRRRSPDAGSTLALALVVAGILSVLGGALLDRSLHGMRRGSWEQGHVAARLIAESAVEELYFDLARQANRQGTACFETLRNLPANSGQGTALAGVSAKSVALDLKEQELALGGQARLSLEASVAVENVATGGSAGRTGVLRAEAKVKLDRKGTSTTERVVVRREFRVARTAPARPLSDAGLFVLRMSRKNPAAAGRPAFALASGGPHSLFQLLQGQGTEGFLPVRRSLNARIARALGDLTPDALREDAQFVLASSRDLALLLTPMLQGDGALFGAIRIESDEPIRIAIPRFRGNASLSFSGPVEIGDIHIEDAERDQLTISSSTRIAVTGQTVQANLVCPSDDPDSLLIARPTSIRGCVIAGRFPRSSGLSARQFGNCSFEIGSAAAPRTVVALAPFPLATYHGLDAAGEPKLNEAAEARR